jgi:hypothetical protein
VLFKSICLIPPYFGPIAVQSLPIDGYAFFIGAANNEANDFPVFCADNYPVDPSQLISVSGNCKECSIMLYVNPPSILASEIKYVPLSYTFSDFPTLCEDL